jgi:streptogramin lyase
MSIQESLPPAPDEAAPPVPGGAAPPTPAPEPVLPPATAPAPRPAAPDDGASRRLYAWLFLAGLAILFALIDPIVISVQPEPLVSLALVAGGLVLLGVGLFRHLRAATWAGALVLWGSIVAGVTTQIAPLATAPGVLWGPRGLLLVVALLGWLFFFGLPGWLWRGVLAAALPTFAALALIGSSAPPRALRAALYWIVVDAHGTVYANDNDSGVVWVFDSNGGVRGMLWPRLAPDPGTPGPGILPAVADVEIQNAAHPTPTPGGPQRNEFLFCGMALDSADNFYLADTELARILRFDSDGQIRATWPLPDNYIPARGCLAADDTHVYLSDRRSIIYVYDLSGQLQTKWELPDVSQGLSATPDGGLLTLHASSVEFLEFPSGASVRHITLPTPSGALEVPYQAVLARRNGEVLVTDLNPNQIRRYGPDGTSLPAWGSSGGMPGNFAGLAGLAEDRQGRVYAVDYLYRVIERFRPDGQVDAIWTVPVDQAETD